MAKLLYILKVHYVMLISNLLIIVLSIGVGSCLLINLLSYQSNIYFTNYEIIKNYLDSSHLFVQIISIVVCMMIFINAFSEKNDNYCIFLIGKGYSKNYYLLSKMFVIITIIFIYVLVTFELFIIIGRVKNTYFDFKYLYLDIYFKIFIVSLFFGFVCLLFQQIIKSLYALLISFSLYICSLIMLNVGYKARQIIGYFIIIVNNYKFINGFFHVIFVLMVLLMFNLIIYNKKDL
ncbi:MAG: hypothetical protein ACOX4W_01225 [Bacilli bacterium]